MNALQIRAPLLLKIQSLNIYQHTINWWEEGGGGGGGGTKRGKEEGFLCFLQLNSADSLNGETVLEHSQRGRRA